MYNEDVYLIHNFTILYPARISPWRPCGRCTRGRSSQSPAG